MGWHFQKKTLGIAWKYTPGDLIWRVFYAPSGSIVGECRNPEKRQTSFFCIDATTGKVQWENFRADEPWWIGIEAVDDASVYFHRFAQPDMPQHKGIECRALADCSFQWSNAELTFWFEQGNKLCAYRDYFEERRSYWIDKRTGEILGEMSGDVSRADEVLTAVVTPQPLVMDSFSSQILTILKKHESDTILSESIEIIETDQHFIIGYYTTSAKQAYTLHLSVINRATADVEFSRVQEKECAFPVPTNFFLVDTMLYFVENQKTLCGVTLWKS